MLTISSETYERIAELVLLETDDEPTYSIEEIAAMVGVSVEVVQYVDRAENDIM